MLEDQNDKSYLLPRPQWLRQVIICWQEILPTVQDEQGRKAILGILSQYKDELRILEGKPPFKRPSQK